MKNKAVYPGTFDPITFGHIDIIKRAADLFDVLIVAVAASHHKSTYFALSERLAMVQEVTAPWPNVKVLSFDNLLVSFAREQGVSCILRGLRAVSDFDYEFQLAGTNRQMAPDIETLFLPASDHYAFVSATMVREIARLGGDVSCFVPPEVLRHLKKGVD